jgi:hypothetical protein
MNTPKPGTVFEHARILTEDYSGRAVCVVTAVRRGCVYYTVNGSGRSLEYATLERWPQVCHRVINSAVEVGA